MSVGIGAWPLEKLRQTVIHDRCAWGTVQYTNWRSYKVSRHRAHPVKRVIIILSIVAAVVAVLEFCVVDRIPPRAMTATQMQVLKRRVLQYAQSQGHLPASLAALPPMEGFNSSVLDGWRREIVFEVSASSVVSFRSLGRDGAVGGSGEDADVGGHHEPASQGRIEPASQIA